MNASASDFPESPRSLAAGVLPAYRARLTELLRLAEAASPAEPVGLWQAATMIVDDLNRDLLMLYRRAETASSRPTDPTPVTESLEQLRDILRARTSRSRPMRDTLQKALAGLSPGP